MNELDKEIKEGNESSKTCVRAEPEAQKVIAFLRTTGTSVRNLNRQVKDARVCMSLYGSRGNQSYCVRLEIPPYSQHPSLRIHLPTFPHSRYSIASNSLVSVHALPMHAGRGTAPSLCMPVCASLSAALCVADQACALQSSETQMGRDTKIEENRDRQESKAGREWRCGYVCCFVKLKCMCMSMIVFICVYMRESTHLRISTHIRVCVCAQAYKCVCISMRVCAHMYAYVCDLL